MYRMLATYTLCNFPNDLFTMITLHIYYYTTEERTFKTFENFKFLNLFFFFKYRTTLFKIIFFFFLTTIWPIFFVFFFRVYQTTFLRLFCHWWPYVREYVSISSNHNYGRSQMKCRPFFVQGLSENYYFWL